MRVLVTGGSGFVGCHVVAQLARSGHDVVALARDPARLESALAGVGAPRVAVARGDVVDRESVTRALQGVDAVIHAAGVYSLDPRRREVMWRTNVSGTEIVLGAAVDAGCDPVVHVSSVTALWPLPQDRPAPIEPPVGTIDTPYVGSKVAAERVARRLQASGAPVVTTYPGNVWGPHDPARGEMVDLLRGFLGNRYPFYLFDAGISVVDVRWLARAHTALLEPGVGPRIVTMGGWFLRNNEWFALLREVTGRRLPQLLPAPRPLCWLVGQLADRVAVVARASLMYGAEKMMGAHWSGQTDDARAIALAGERPPPKETLREAIAWAVDAGHLPRRWAGRAASGS